MKTAEQLGEFKTADKPYVPTMDEALAKVKEDWLCTYTTNLMEFCDEDKVERLLKLLCESNTTLEIQCAAWGLRNLMNDAWKERAEKYRDSFLGVPRHDE